VAHPLTIAALVLAGVSAAGLAFDVRAAREPLVRFYGVFALVLKALLGAAFLYQIVYFRLVPADRYDELAQYLSFLSLVAVGIPMVGIAVVLEFVARHQLTREPPHAVHATSSAAE
jgi:hypothetical protein